jgi:hypothetical protein
MKNKKFKEEDGKKNLIVFSPRSQDSEKSDKAKN